MTFSLYDCKNIFFTFCLVDLNYLSRTKSKDVSYGVHMTMLLCAAESFGLEILITVLHCLPPPPSCCLLVETGRHYWKGIR